MDRRISLPLLLLLACLAPCGYADVIIEKVGDSTVGARALVLSGREGMFSAGLDVPVLIELEREELSRALGAFFDAIEALAASAVPVAAAITGHSPAGGAVLSLCCDWRVMAEGDFTIGLSEVRIGIPVPRILAELAVIETLEPGI